jgi:3-hydroxyacyl-CoA dehydrogenase
MDIAGLDVLQRVADDLAERLAGRWDAERFRVPDFVRAMVDRGVVGEKAGGGFYRRVPAPGGHEIHTIDLDSLRDSSAEARYRARAAVRLPSVEAVEAVPDVAARTRQLFTGTDRAGQLLRRILADTLVYAARVAPEIAGSPEDVDRAMRWGFGWPLGPFELWDAIGFDAVMSATGTSDPPPLVAELVQSGKTRFRAGSVPPVDASARILETAKAKAAPVRKNAGASVIDLGDGVLCVEFHSKMNTIGGDALQMLEAGVAEAAARGVALVVGSEADLFSAGANLLLLLLEAQEGNWDEVDGMVRAFQRATMSLATSPVPVIAAPSGLALGGGCEICLHCDRMQAAAETYLGLVETGVGLIPAGGGTKELLLRAVDASTTADERAAAVQRAFETMALGKVSTSAAHAAQLGYLREIDGITMNRDRVIADAKALALHRAAGGYRPRTRRLEVPVGGADQFATLALGVHLAHRAGRASDHDVRVARKLAWVITGGDLPHRATVSEDYLLDLEREAFLSLCGEAKTLERIGYTLKTGKVLRN